MACIFRSNRGLRHLTGPTDLSLRFHIAKEHSEAAALGAPGSGVYAKKRLSHWASISALRDTENKLTDDTMHELY